MIVDINLVLQQQMNGKVVVEVGNNVHQVYNVQEIIKHFAYCLFRRIDMIDWKYYCYDPIKTRDMKSCARGINIVGEECRQIYDQNEQVGC